MTHRLGWEEVLDDKVAINEMRMLDQLEGWGYIGGYRYVEETKPHLSLLEKGLIERSWDWPGKTDMFNLTLKGRQTFEVMSLRYGIPLLDELVPRRPFYGRLEDVCGLTGEENRLLLYLHYKDYVFDSPNADALLQSLEAKRLIIPYASGAWERTLEGRVVLRHVLKALSWKEEDIPAVRAKGK